MIFAIGEIKVVKWSGSFKKLLIQTMNNKKPAALASIIMTFVNREISVILLAFQMYTIVTISYPSIKMPNATVLVMLRMSQNPYIFSEVAATRAVFELAVSIIIVISMLTIFFDISYFTI